MGQLPVRCLSLPHFFGCDLLIELEGDIHGFQRLSGGVEFQDKIFEYQAYLAHFLVQWIEGDEPRIFLSFEHLLVFYIGRATRIAHAQVKAIKFVAALTPNGPVVALKTFVRRKRRQTIGMHDLALIGVEQRFDRIEQDFGVDAVFGLIATSLFIGVWLALAGLAWWVVPIYLFAMFTLFVGITRVVAEGGIAATRAPLIASDFVTSGLGSAVLGGQTLTALSFTYVWAADIRTFVLASCTNGLKLAEEYLSGSKRA